MNVGISFVPFRHVRKNELNVYRCFSIKHLRS